MTGSTSSLRPAFGLSFEDLYRREGLVRLDAEFLVRLASRDAVLAARLVAARGNPAGIAPKDESSLLLDLAPHLDTFVGELFGIEEELAALRQRHLDLGPLYEIKRQFVQRKAATAIPAAEAAVLGGVALTEEISRLLGASPGADILDFEVAFANRVREWLAAVDAHTTDLEVAVRYAAWALHSKAGKARHEDGVLFHTPAKTDPMNLLHHGVRSEEDGVTSFAIEPAHTRHREGFALTDRGTDLVGALDEANYCIWCHNQGKDSCSRGLREKAVKGATEAPPFKKSAFGVTLAGCPLTEKISEFHSAKVAGHAIGALAVITVDNPIVAATGHRICNDCMKSCIYQKQEPVDIPQVETRTLKDVLSLPWGFEIYSLLTRWNPLNLARPFPLEDSGRKVLVVGLGPAGFGLSHNLMMDGHTVVAIDGLKIEPLAEEISGVRLDGTRVPFTPIRDIASLNEDLGNRVMAGFGGVAEYGITVRWDKNFLKIVRLLLERRARFSMIGGVRFGSTITLEDAWETGFDHVAICIGAGKPTVLDVPNGLARGVRAASDFLMALQLTGAAKTDSIANMQVRLPVVVVGGGLTAIDTATESLAYYVVQVEKFAARYHALAEDLGEAGAREGLDQADNEVADEFLAHAAAIAAERTRAAAAGEEPDLLALLKAWGGATIAYRRRLIDSPSYTLNHEEIEKALEEGAVFSECLSPLAIDIDSRRTVEAIRFTKQVLGEDGRWTSAGEHRLAARTVFVAAGTQPNTVLAREDEANFRLDGKYFRACDEDGNPVKPIQSLCKPDRADVLLSRSPDGRFVSFFGDVHPSFFGNVVKALGSAKQGFPVVSRVLAKREPANREATAEFFAKLSKDLRPTVERIERLTPTIVEVVIRAPAAARRFRPGQFYRLQNFETLAPLVNGTKLQMEGIALTGAWVDPVEGLVSTITLEMGGSSSLCAKLEPGEPVVLMGPTGAPTHIVGDETVILAGGGLGNAVLFSIGQAMRRAGSKVLYFAAYKKMIDRYKVSDIENAADVVVWCCDEAPGFAASRPGDKTYVGNVVQAMRAYATGGLGDVSIPLSDADRIIAIGSDRMMAAVGESRHTVLAPYLKPGHCGIGSINSPMQCMMKEICAQCLQAHRDPATGKTTYVFSCFNQDQDLDKVDFEALRDRLGQNALAEKLTAKWIARCLEASPPRV